MKALIVEDNPHICRALCGALDRWGFVPISCSAGVPALQRWQQEKPGLVVLDLGLPDMDGLDVLQQARKLGLHTPVLLLTARVAVGDRILGLNFGADDYLTKPFDYDELHARLLALVRRHCGGTVPACGAAVAPCEQARRLGGLEWRADGGEFHCGGERLPLSRREAALLRALVQYPNQARPKQALLQAVFGRGDMSGDALEVVAFRLRQRIAVRCGVTIVTLRGLGYLIKARSGDA
jgi:two-component system response regulator TctD